MPEPRGTLRAVDTSPAAGLIAQVVLLAESFGRDVLWLWHQRSREHERPNRPAGRVPRA